jgi:Cof subfamily protein (haloacid dehalogenase superfamily)
VPDLRPGPRHAEWRPARPRYVALDVDGTLVGPGHHVTQVVVEAAAAAVEAGLLVGIATGRMRQGIEAVLEQVPLPGPHLVSNGAVVVHEGEVLAQRSLDPGAVTALRAACLAAGVYLEVYVPDGYLVTREDDRAEAHWELLGVEPLGVLDPRQELDVDVSKVTAIAFDDDDPDAIAALLGRHGLLADVGISPATPGLRYVNGIDPSAGKGTALRDAAGALGIDLAATVAVGDAANDVSMLRAAGTAIAMGQADGDVLAAAHLVAPPVVDDGVAAALDEARDGFVRVPGPGGPEGDPAA